MSIEWRSKFTQMVRLIMVRTRSLDSNSPASLPSNIDYMIMAFFEDALEDLP